MFKIGKKAYFVGSFDHAERGTITDVKKWGLVSLVTIQTADGQIITGYENQFSLSKPAILNYLNK